MKTGKNDSVKTTVRFRAEIWDQMQLFFKEYNDHQLHAVIYFKDSWTGNLFRGPSSYLWTWCPFWEAGSS